MFGENFEILSSELTGRLLAVEVYIFYDEPLLFLCEDQERNPYLCSNIDYSDGVATFLVGKTTAEVIVKMEMGEVDPYTVYKAMLEGDCAIKIYEDYEKEKVSCEIVKCNDLTQDILPTKGCFLKKLSPLFKSRASKKQ